MFLCLNLIELDNHIILPDQQHSYDYASLNINIYILEEFILNNVSLSKTAKKKKSL